MDGVGISNQYIPILENLHTFVNKDKFSSLKLILADEINLKYNKRKKGQLAEDLFNLAKKIQIEKVMISVEKWNYFSNNKKYQLILKKYKNLFRQNPNFKKEVINIVKLNRKKIDKSNIDNSANYVLEELASINFMHNKGFTKIVQDKEKIFDDLAIKYSFVKDIKTILF